jgi:hypothetical protein
VVQDTEEPCRLIFGIPFFYGDETAIEPLGRENFSVDIREMLRAKVQMAVIFE